MFLLFQLMVNVAVFLIPAQDVQVENSEVWTVDRHEQCFGPEHRESGKGSGWIITFALDIYIYMLRLKF